MDVSIIICAYNRLWSLPKAIDSCRRVKCKLEIIVIDDASTDGTWDWLQKQPDLVILRQNINWGKPWAVNRAFQLAKGKYIRFLDSDDWLYPDANDKQFEIAEKTQADLVVGGYEIYNEHEELIRSQNWIDCDDFIAQQLGEGDSSHYSAFLFKKEFIKDIPHRTSFASAGFASRDDRCLMLEVALAKPKIAVVYEPTLCRRHHNKKRLLFATSLRGLGTDLQHLLIYKNIINQLSIKGELTPRRINAACDILWVIAHSIARTHLDEGCEVASWIYQLKPDFQPHEKGLLGELYSRLGFRNTEIILRIRRAILSLFRPHKSQKYLSLPSVHNSKIGFPSDRLDVSMGNG